MTPIRTHADEPDRHLRHRRHRQRAVQHQHGGGDRRRGSRSARRQARQPQHHQQERLGRRAGGAGRRISMRRVPVVERCLDELGICFCFAPQLHPAMKHVAPVRKKLGFATIFNLLGPLCNPAGATRQLLGVGKRELHQTMAEVLARLGTERAVVVHGTDGLGEVSLSAPTEVIEVTRRSARIHLAAGRFWPGRRPSKNALRVSDAAAKRRSHSPHSGRRTRPAARRRRAQRRRGAVDRRRRSIAARCVPSGPPRRSTAAKLSDCSSAGSR